jgi:cell division protease FtsH
MLDMITVTMAGRIAEEIVSGDISTGASGDIQQATNLARAMVCQWGMSDKLGMVQYGNDDEYIFLGREMTRGKIYSEYTAQEIDTEVKKIIDEAYKVAKDIIDTNRDTLELIANLLSSMKRSMDRKLMKLCAPANWLAGRHPRSSPNGRSGRHAVTRSSGKPTPPNSPVWALHPPRPENRFRTSRG